MVDPAALLTAFTGGVVGLAGVLQANRARRETVRQQQAANTVAQGQARLEETQQALAAQSGVIATLERQTDRAVTRAEVAEQRAEDAEKLAESLRASLVETREKLIEVEQRLSNVTNRMDAIELEAQRLRNVISAMPNNAVRDDERHAQTLAVLAEVMHLLNTMKGTP